MIENHLAQIQAQLKEILELAEEYGRRLDVKEIRPALAGAEPPDDVSFVLARAVERLAVLVADIRVAQSNLRFCEAGVEEKLWPETRLDTARRKLADLKAEKEQAVLDLAAHLAAWRNAP